MKTRLVEQLSSREYEAHVASILKQIERQDAEALADVLRLLRETRLRIAQELVTAKGWQFWHLRDLKIIVERALRDFERRYFLALAGRQEEAYELGLTFADKPLSKAGLTVPFLAYDPYQLMVLQAFSADLVRGLVGDALAKINTTLTLGVLGQKSVIEVMQEITRILGEEGMKAVGGIAYRAERIVRTELGRITSMANFARQKDVARMVPGLMKEWRSALLPGRTRGSPGTTGVFDHWSAHGQRVPVEQPFVVSGEELMYPLDPAGSPGNTINCMCISVLWHSTWEVSVRAE